MRKVLSKDGTSIAFDQSGQGPAIILVAPTSATRLDQTSLAAALAPDFTVFAYDRRGRGDSGDTPPYVVEREIEDLKALIDETGGSAFVSGHSSGAILALEVARQIPRKIAKLALYEPPFIIDDSRTHAPKDYAQRLSELASAGRQGEAVEYFMTGVGLSPEMIAQSRQSPMWPGLEKIAHTLAYDVTIIGDTQSGDPHTLRKWASIQIPTLVMDGTIFLGREESHTFMHHGAQELIRILPNAHYHTFEGQDHGPADDILAPALKEFFLG